MGHSRAPWGLSGAQWGSVEVSGAQWGSVGVSGAQWGSVCNVYTPASLVLNKFGKIEAHHRCLKNALSKGIVHLIKHGNFQLYRRSTLDGALRKKCSF